MFRSQVRDEIELLRSSWSLYRAESGALARALLIALAFSAVCTVLVQPFFIHGGRLSALGETAAFVVVAALVLSPLSGGLVGMVLGRVRETRPGRARDVFLGYRRFLPLAVAGALLRLRLSAAPHTGSWHAGLPLRLLAVVVGFGVSLLLVSSFRPSSTSVSHSGRRCSRRSASCARLSSGARCVAAVLILVVGLLLDVPLNLIAHRSFGLASLYGVIVVLLYGPFSHRSIRFGMLRSSGRWAGRAEWMAARPTSASWCHSVPCGIPEEPQVASVPTAE